MHRRQIFQGHFGKHYKLHFIQNGPEPRSLTPLRFADSHSARRFLSQLHTPQSYWQWLTRDYHDAANFSGHQRDHLQVATDWVLQGRLRIYEVELPDSHALSRSSASIQDRQGYQFQFAPMKQALASLAQPQRFNSIQQVYETLYDLAPNLEQLQSVVADLQLIPAPEQQTYSQLMDALAEGLAEERVALYINAPFKRPEPAGAATETTANMPGNRKVELAPAMKNSNPNSRRVVESSLEASQISSDQGDGKKTTDIAPDGQRIILFDKEDIKVKKLYGGELYEFYIDGPDGPLEFAEANVDVDEKAMSFFINNNFNHGYVLKGRNFGLTNEVLQRSIDLYSEDHGAPPEFLNGNIIKKNLANFQREYILVRNNEPVASAENAADAAIRRISFGREREKVGYGDMSVNIRKYGSVEIDGKIYNDVPTSVSIVAKRPLV